MISSPSKLWHADLSKPVNNSEEGDDDERGPPPPKDEEVVLVEHVVWEKAEEVVHVCGSRRSSHGNVTGDLSWEQFAHWVDRPDSVRGGQFCQCFAWRNKVSVVLDADAITCKFFVEDRVENISIDEDRDKVENLTQSEA